MLYGSLLLYCICPYRLDAGPPFFTEDPVDVMLGRVTWQTIGQQDTPLPSMLPLQPQVATMQGNEGSSRCCSLSPQRTTAKKCADNECAQILCPTHNATPFLNPLSIFNACQQECEVSLPFDSRPHVSSPTHITSLPHVASQSHIASLLHVAIPSHDPSPPCVDFLPVVISPCVQSSPSVVSSPNTITLPCIACPSAASPAHLAVDTSPTHIAMPSHVASVPHIASPSVATSSLVASPSILTLSNVATPSCVAPVLLVSLLHVASSSNEESSLLSPPLEFVPPQKGATPLIAADDADTALDALAVEDDTDTSLNAIAVEDDTDAALNAMAVEDDTDTALNAMAVEVDTGTALNAMAVEDDTDSALNTIAVEDNRQVNLCDSE